ncbi:hypothetical protein GCM10022236_41520 [Microlunatus ginsengisoli]|uniref:Uncharacterized protein n=1 Tax=Microlunatus ginsengisoli TaxID=363863 RepID=A0ABP7AKM9_9ACTN
MATHRTVRVTPAQKQAAKALVERSAKTGRSVSTSVTKIANAISSASPGPSTAVDSSH